MSGSEIAHVAKDAKQPKKERERSRDIMAQMNTWLVKVELAMG